MNITVFGPLRLDGPEHLGPRERVVLSTLLLYRNQPVRTDTIADALWSDAPPLTWRKQLQASVVQVRRAVGPDRVVTVADGYQLRAEVDEVDVDRFDELIARARMHASASEPECAVTAAERDARQNVRLRRLLVASAALLVVVLIAGGLAVFNAVRSQRAEMEAQLSAVVSSSESLRSSDRATAALLAVEAYRRWPDDPRSRSALLGTFTSAPGFLGYSYVAGADDVYGTVLDDGDHAIVPLPGGDFARIELASGEIVQRFDGLANDDRPVQQLAASANGDIAVVAYPAQVLEQCGEFAVVCSDIRVLDLRTGDWRSVTRKADIEKGDLAVHPSGSTAAFVQEWSGRVRILPLDHGSLEPLEVPSERTSSTARGASGSIAFTDDGLLAVGSPVSLRLVDPDTAAVLTRIPTPTFTANQAIATADDGVLVASGSKGLMRVDAKTGEVVWSVTFGSRLPIPCPRLAVSVPAGAVYCGTYYGTIEERRLEDGGLTGVRFDPQFGDVGELTTPAR
ncbi:hypothetical protein [Cryobacterium sp. BB736]|uniref:hypothetical protein n=1 Tax=Cryobacterium sp. BB736 TaxID=2746963 RepID=UPI001875AAA9|nr:hypothetical protein [Cryobacterium sp. BB736]